MRSVTHPGPEQFSLPDVLHALSDPVRLQIVAVLSVADEVSCGHLGVSVSKSTLTHHLKVLREAGVTRTRCEGVQRLVSLRGDDLEGRFPGLLASVLAGSEIASDHAAGLAAVNGRSSGSGSVDGRSMVSGAVNGRSMASGAA